MRKFIFEILLLILLLKILSCTEELDYPEQAKAFHAQYAKSREMDLLLRFAIKLRNATLYLQECQTTPEDTIKIWAVYENYVLDESNAEIELAHLRMAFTPFDDPRGGRIIPKYETISATDTASGNAKAVLQIRETIHAFNRLGMREIICGGQGVVYLVQPKFMLIYVADPAKAPDSVKNIATKLDESWYFEISFEHQDEQRRKLGTVLREFRESLQSQKTDTTK